LNVTTLSHDHAQKKQEGGNDINPIVQFGIQRVKFVKRQNFF